MKKIILTLLMISVLVCGCGGENNDVVQEEKYIDGFEKAEYEKFNSYASENGLDGTPVYIEGKVISQTKLENEDVPILSIVVEQEDGNRWCVGVASETEFEDIEDKKIRAFGIYGGFSDVANLPAVNILSDDEDTIEKVRLEVKENGEYVEVWSFFHDYLEKEIQNEIESSSEQEQKELEDIQESEPFFSYSGTGDDIVSDVKTELISYAHIIHEGGGYFSVKGHYGEDYDLLVNTTDSYEGATLIYPNKEYTFEVSAKGDWTIELYKIGTSSTDSFSGRGDFVTPVFLKTSDIYEINTTGNGYFSVKGWNDSSYELLVNTTDENYSGKVMFKSNEDYAFFEISASREWEIKPVVE